MKKLEDAGINLEIDESTGLPAVPDNYFWRVKFATNSSIFDSETTSIVVELRRKRWIGSTYHDYRTSVMTGFEWLDNNTRVAIDYSRDTDRIKRNISALALSIALQAYADLADELSNKNSNYRQFAGDYPPKKLEK